MAHVKAGGTTKGNRDSEAKRLGVKKYGGNSVKPGNIIVRQRGSEFHPGKGTKMGKDYTIYSITEGTVAFRKKLGEKMVVVESAQDR